MSKEVESHHVNASTAKLKGVYDDQLLHTYMEHITYLARWGQTVPG